LRRTRTAAARLTFVHVAFRHCSPPTDACWWSRRLASYL